MDKGRQLKWSRKRVLVTGGAGFLGSALVRRLKEMSAEVIVLDDLSTGDRGLVKGLADEFVQDKVTLESLSKITDPDIIFHLGAPSSIILFDKNRDALKDTVGGMKAVLDYCASTHVQKLVYATSSSVYGNSKLPQSESMATIPVNEYGVAKLSCEHLARVHPDVQSIGLRIFAGYGPGEGKKVGFCSVIGIFIANICANERRMVFGNGSQTRDFVYVDDIIECLLRAAHSGFHGVINVGSGDSQSFLQVLDMISTHLERKVVPRFVPEPKSYFEHTLADTSRLASVLNLQPVRLINGITKYLQVSAQSGALKI